MFVCCLYLTYIFLCIIIVLALASFYLRRTERLYQWQVPCVIFLLYEFNNNVKKTLFISSSTTLKNSFLGVKGGEGKKTSINFTCKPRFLAYSVYEKKRIRINIKKNHHNLCHILWPNYLIFFQKLYLNHLGSWIFIDFWTKNFHVLLILF